MPITDDIYKELLEVDTEKKLMDFYKKIEKEEINKENVSTAIAAFILAAGNLMVKKHADLMDKNVAAGIFWAFLRHWLPEFSYAPLRILVYEDLLFPSPQTEKNYKTITKDIQDWLKQRAKSYLENNKDAPEELKKHWQAVVDGHIPFDLELEEDFLKKATKEKK